ncbi:phospholipase D family protein [uncultured Helicobacter sp.]|uniref:phospholipase D family protein n=1 Tax=uncultured Helicobacter sp. TaxID=175537 RepID=UPI00260A6409|nr:phospholipase D family protein [uncultured Helicobacter sp.]
MNDTHIALIIFGVFFVLAGCASVVPSTRYLKSPPESIPFTSFSPLDSPIALPYAKELAQAQHSSGAMLISDGSFAFLHRAALARRAKFSLEIQTYIYKNDIASRVLMHEIWLAANRGVKVKMLVDDNGLDSDYSDIIALNNHPNIEVKIFNPYRNRIKLFRLPEMIFHFNRINRRMHNKLFIADSVGLIIGGRNIADNYFNNKEDVNFSDTDAFFIGDVASQARESFRAYWDYHRAIPVEFLPSKRKMKKFMKDYNEIIAGLEADSNEWERYESAIVEFLRQYENRENTIYWGDARLVADDPTKIDAKNPTSKVYEALKQILPHTTDSMYISSAYLVPGKRGLAQIQESIEKGISVYILTNSLSSTDSLPVYAGWERYRDKLARMGAQVYEYRKGAGKIKVKGKLTSGASLHSKTLVFDKKIAWIGSFNLDPRSSIINTEVVAIFDNENFAKESTKLIHIDMQSAWHIQLQGNKTLWCAQNNLNDENKDEDTNAGEYKKSGTKWIDEVGGYCTSTMPDTTFWLRSLNFFMRIFPESQI